MFLKYLVVLVSIFVTSIAAVPGAQYSFKIVKFNAEIRFLPITWQPMVCRLSPTRFGRTVADNTNFALALHKAGAVTRKCGVCPDIVRYVLTC